MATTNADSVIREALGMPENERARIAERLIASLHEPPSREIDKAWHREIEKRAKEIDAGKVDCLPWEAIKNRLHGNSAHEG